MQLARRRLVLSAVLLAATLLNGCTAEEPNPISVGTRRLSVTNYTKTRWVNVEVWMNNHYRATVPSLDPGQRLDVPLDAFVAGNGHRFQPKNQPVTGVQVLAKGEDGTAVKINWGKGRQWY